MDLAVIKQGPKCNAQLSQIRALASVAADHVPRVLARWSSGFAMEVLRPYEPRSVWPQEAAVVAGASFWNAEPLYDRSHFDWRATLHETLGIHAPDWTWLGVRECATHGDLTLCNTMKRVRDDGEYAIVFVDPVQPERVPQIAATDQARIVQSMLGWEIMTGHMTQDDNDFEWFDPYFLYDNEKNVAIVAFWTYVMMARIASSDAVTLEERAWAAHLRDELRGGLQ